MNSIVTVEELSSEKKLDPEFLRGLGVVDSDDGILIPYFDLDGNRYSRARLRIALKAGDGSQWTPGEEPIIPYGLHRLRDAQQEGFLVFLEGESDCWTLWSNGFPALGFPGATMTGKLEAAYLKDILRVYIVREPDQGGETFTSKLQERLIQIGYTGEVFIVSCSPFKDPSELHCDDPDSFPQRFQGILDTAEPIAIIQSKSTNEIEPPRPLKREIPSAEPFPIEALGELLGGAAVAIRESTQAPLAICANSILAAAALAVQPFADIEIDGRRFPLSNFFLTIGETGERKSGVDNLALHVHREIQKERMKIYERDKEMYAREADVYEKAKNEALTQNKGRENKRVALYAIGDPPEKPRLPLFLCQEPTYEGLIRLISDSPSLGLFADEGARMLGGFAMNTENQLKTAAGLSELWDGKPVTRVRSGEGSSLLCGRRLSVHLMAQPSVSQILLSNNGLSDQGLLSRFLSVFPDSTCGLRFYKNLNTHNDSRFRSYLDRMREILESPMPIQECAELNPQQITLSLEAKTLWIKFHDRVENELGKNGVLSPIRAMANKAPEHAARLAGILSMIDDPHTSIIKESEMKNGTILAGYFLNEALRLFQSESIDQRLQTAEKLLEWLQRSDSDVITLVEIYRFGINCVRTAKAAREIMGILQDHGWVIPMQEGAEFEGTHRNEAWKVVKQ